jgi:hypothetical protein
MNASYRLVLHKISLVDLDRVDRDFIKDKFLQPLTLCRMVNLDRSMECIVRY